MNAKVMIGKSKLEQDAYWILSRLMDTVKFVGPHEHERYEHKGTYADCTNALCVCHKLQVDDCNKVMFRLSQNKD